MRQPPPERPRVLVLPSSYFAGARTIGGGERYAYEYARAISRLTPTTLALFDLEAGHDRADDLDVRTFAVRGLEERRMLPFPAETLRAVGEFDVIHLMVFPTPVSDLLTISARLRRQTVVLTDVGGGIPCLSTYLQRVHPRAGISRLADGLALLSRHSASQFAEWPQPKTILFGGAVLPDLAPGAATPEGYALYVGRLLPHKGVLPLIEALGSETEIRIVGRPYDPDYFERLRAASIGKRVRFITDADDNELRRQYLGASVVLQPSLPVLRGSRDTSELLGLVTLEGMAHAKPVIVTRTASLPELVIDGETGYVVDPGNADALRERVERLVSDDSLSVALGLRARAHVERNFTWAQVANRGMELYRSLRSGGSERASAGPDRLRA